MKLKHQLTVKVYQHLQDNKNITIDDLFVSIWKNTNYTNGMALTKLGLEYFVNLLDLKQWKFSIPDITSGDVVMMDRYMIYPYYLVSQKTKTHKNLIIFDESTATQLVLYNNDIKLFLSAYDNDSDRPVIRRQK
jgi:hypothetical protein